MHDPPETLEGIAVACLRAIEDRTLSAAQLIAALRADGFDGFLVDYRRWSVTFYTVDGPTINLSLSGVPVRIAPTLDAPTLQALLADGDCMTSAYSASRYRTMVTQAGCGGYLVSVSRNHVVYMGLDGTTHVEELTL